MKDVFRQERRPLWQHALILMSLLIFGFGAFAVAGCAKSKPKATKTTAELRQGYINQLRAAGVRVIVLGETVRLVLPNDRLFNADSANLQSDRSRVLNATARLIRSYDTTDVRVVSYSDNRFLSGAPAKRKQALTARQAQVVASYLWSKGIDTRLLYAVGAAQRNAIATNTTARGRDLNRRIEISFHFYPKQNSWE